MTVTYTTSIRDGTLKGAQLNSKAKAGGRRLRQKVIRPIRLNKKHMFSFFRFW